MSLSLLPSHRPASAASPLPRPTFRWIDYVAFVVYESLLPFYFQWRSPAEAWRIDLGLGDDIGGRPSPTDFATNHLVLFVPLAFIWIGGLRPTLDGPSTSQDACRRRCIMNSRLLRRAWPNAVNVDV